MQTQIDNLLSRAFKTPFFWAKDSTVKIIVLLIVVYVFVFPMLQSLQEYAKHFPILKIASDFVIFLSVFFSPADIFLIILLVLVCLAVGYVIKEVNKNKIVKDSFNHNLNLWSIPFNAGWSIQKCTDENGNMLVITGSNTAGILKAAYNWYDYEFSFWTKISEKNESKVKLVIRAENSSNGVVFEITKSSLTPYFLHDGKLILDDQNISKFSLILTENIWFKIAIKVIGNDVEIITGEENKTNYRLNTLSANVEDSVLNNYTSSPTLEEIRRSSKKWLDAIRKALDLNKQAQDIPDQEERTQKEKEASDAFANIPKNMTQISLDYSKGTVGFMSPNVDKSYIRKVKVRKI